MSDRIPFLLAIVAILSLLPACSGPGSFVETSQPGSTSTSTSDPPIASGVVGTEGGTVEVTDGPLAGTSVVIPPGALDAPLDITIDAGDAVAVGDLVSADAAAEFGPSGTTFSQPVTVTMPFSAGTLHDLLVLQRNDETGQVTPLGPVLDPDGLLASVQVTSFSTFQPSRLGRVTRPPFVAPVAVFSGDLAGRVAVGDLDGDSRPDLVTAFEAGETLLAHVFIQNADGTFTDREALDLASNNTDLELRDVSGDGRLDLVTCSRADDTVKILLGQGDGSFGAATSVAVGETPRGMDLGDLDGDGRPDVVTANQDGGTLSVVLNGAAGFGAASSFATGLQPLDVALADYDRDGDLDVATVQGRRIVILPGNGQGTLGGPVDVSSAATDGADAVLVAADLNRDGRPDLVAAHKESNEVHVFLATGPLAFAAPSIMAMPPGNVSTLAAGDLTSDSRPDLAVGYDGQQVVSVLPGNGNGTFGSATDLPTGNQQKKVVIADVNGDARPDLAAACRFHVAVHLRRPVGGGFEAAGTQDLGGGDLLSLGDLDGDGDLDAARAVDFKTYPNNGDGTFGAAVEDTPLGSATDMALADVDGDGIRDAQLVLSGLGEVWTFLGQGNLLFDFASSISNNNVGCPRRLRVADMNGDTRPDLVTTNTCLSDAHSVSIMRGNGDGTFQTAVVVNTSAGQFPTELDVADFDGDARLDVAVSQGGNTGEDPDVVVLLQENGFTFSLHETLLPDGVGPLAAADLNQDGDQDLVVCSTGFAHFLPGQGDGTFGARTDLPGVDDARKAVLVDLVGDANLDVVVLSRGVVRMFPGTGAGTFGAPIGAVGGKDPQAMALGDIDGDGVSDVLLAEPDGPTRVIEKR